MNRRQTRLLAITEILTNNSIGSQDELVRLLASRGFKVTQATLSRDLRSLRTVKVAAGMGGYRYIVPEPGDVPEDEVYEQIPSNARGDHHPSVVAIHFSGSMLVVRTLEGFASGLAYDLDRMDTSMILGTIAGADTVMIAIPDCVSRAEVLDFLADMLPPHTIREARERYC